MNSGGQSTIINAIRAIKYTRSPFTNLPVLILYPPLKTIKHEQADF